MGDNIILVNEQDQEIGTGSKQKVHEEGKLHRAFSIYIFNTKGQLLLQKRHSSKYHSGGLWTNTCCSHPRQGEPLDQAIHRRLKEEMGLDCELRETMEFIYTVKFDNGLTENEYLHVFQGVFDGNPEPSPEEAEDWNWVDIDKLKKDIKQNPDKYTYWFKVTLEKM